MDRRKYEKNASAGNKGEPFQVNLSTLLLLKAMSQSKDWWLSTENSRAGKFDDVVLECPDGDILLQAKYRENKKTITFGELLSTNTKKDDFSLPKYFISYQEIKCRFKMKNIIVCTNASPDKETLGYINSRRASPESMLYYEVDSCLVYTFNDNILSKLKSNAATYLQQCTKKKIDASEITDENLKDFLGHLQFYFNYPSGKSIENVIKKQLSVLKNTSSFYNEISSTDIHFKMKNWLHEKVGYCLDKTTAKAMFFDVKRDKYWQKLKGCNVFFRHNKLNFSSPTKIYHIVDDEGSLMRPIQVYRTLQESVDIENLLNVHPESSAEELIESLEAFKLPKYSFIIIIWPKDMENSLIQIVTSKLEHVLNNKDYKKVIFITRKSNDLTTQFQVRNLSHEVIHRSIIFDDLLEETQKNLSMKRIINFQGSSLNLEELFASGSTEDYGAALHSELLEKLLKGEEVKVGSRMNLLDHHIKRLYISRTFLRNDEQIEEQDIFDIKEKVILIADSPGMGKNTVLTNLAISIKKKHPQLWVVKLILSNYSKYFNYLKKGNEGKLNIAELLDSQIETRLKHQFEKFLFSRTNRVVLMLDGVDEISPDYTELVKKLIIQCKQRQNFAKIFVTSRSHLTEQLENKLRLKSFKLQSFTKQNQIDFLTNYWSWNLKLNNTNKAKCERYAEALLNQMWLSRNWYYVRESHFASIPLQVRMLAEIFQERTRLEDSLNWQGCKEYLAAKEEVLNLPKQIGFAKLFKMFLDKKRSIFLEKGNPTAHLRADHVLNKQFDEYLAYHRVLALEVILDKRKCELFTFYKNDKGNIKADVFDIGIVQKVNGRIHFIHRTFVEYFFAECLVRELQRQNENVGFQKLIIDEVLQSYWYSVVRPFFNSCLQDVVNSLPSSVFKKYERCVSIKNLENPPYLIHALARNGYVAILQLILKCIDFRIIYDKDTTLLNRKHGLFASVIHVFFNWKYRNRNTLNALRFCVQRSGVNINRYGHMPIQLAINRGHLNMVKFLLERGAMINSNELRSCTETPLYEAIHSGHYDIVKFLVEQGADIKANGEQDYQILHKAIYENHVRIAEYLLEKILETDDSAPRDPNVTYTAAYLGRLDILDELLKKGVTDLITVLFDAAQGGQLDTIRYLVKQGVDISSRDEKGNTALHIVSSKSSLTSTANLLIDLGIDINARNFNEETALHTAAAEGNLDTVKYLLKCGADITAATKDHRTALHLAVTSSRLDVVKVLVENGVSVDARDDVDNTALKLAISHRQFHIMEYLLCCSADINTKYNNGSSVLHYAIELGRIDSVRSLVERGADLNVKDKRGRTALHLAIMKRNFYIIKLFLESGIDVNAKDNYGYTALHLAVELSSLEPIELLIRFGIDVNVKESKGLTALHVAAKKKKLSMVKLLTKYGADINATDEGGYTALHSVVEDCLLGPVELLVELGTDINIKENSGRTALHLAAEKRNLDIVKLLVNSGVDVNATDKYGHTALHSAVLAHSSEPIELLIELGVDVNIRENKGRTALHLAAAESLDMVKLLVKSRIDINAKDMYGCTALHSAVEGRSLGSIELLVKHGVDVNVREDNGCTALHLAAAKGNVDMVKLLVKSCIDINVRDNCGYTALHASVGACSLGLIEVLIKHGVDVNIRDNGGRTALHRAVAMTQRDAIMARGRKSKRNMKTMYPYRLSVVKYLIKHGADLTVKDSKGDTVATLIKRMDNPNLNKYLNLKFWKH